MTHTPTCVRWTKLDVLEEYPTSWHILGLVKRHHMVSQLIDIYYQACCCLLLLFVHREQWWPWQNPYKLEDWVWWVLRWLIRPILALNDQPHVGQTREESIKADVDEFAALDMRSSRFFWAPAVLLSTCIWQPFWVRLRQVGRSTATLSHVSMSMSKISEKPWVCPWSTSCAHQRHKVRNLIWK